MRCSFLCMFRASGKSMSLSCSLACGEMAVLGINTLHNLCTLHNQSSSANSDMGIAESSAQKAWKAEPLLVLTDSVAFAASPELPCTGAAETRLVTRDVMHAILERKLPAYTAFSGGYGKREEQGATTKRPNQTAAIFKQPQPCDGFQQPRWEWQVLSPYMQKSWTVHDTRKTDLK